MNSSMYELRKLYDMIGTVASAQYADQIQRVCCAFYEEGIMSTKVYVPDFKTELEYENYVKGLENNLHLAEQKYRGKIYRDGLKAGAEAQQNAVEAAFSLRPATKSRMSIFDIDAVLDYLRLKVPHDR